MKHKDFEKLVETRLTQCNLTLNVKGEEYSRNGDRLHNFKTAARMDGTYPEKALWGMQLKHLVSVKDMIDDLELGKMPTPAQIKEKFGDVINYFLLLEGLFEERREMIAELEK